MSKHDFASVFACAFKITYKYLLVLSKPNQCARARLGLIVAKRRLPLAVDRNQFKRIARESFRHHQQLLKGLDIIVLLRSECTPLCKMDKRQGKVALREDIDHLWHVLSTTSLKPV